MPGEKNFLTSTEIRDVLYFLDTLNSLDLSRAVSFDSHISVYDSNGDVIGVMSYDPNNRWVFITDPYSTEGEDNYAL